MDLHEEAVETKEQEAADAQENSEEVKNDPQEESIDYDAMLQATLDAQSKAEEERDNYKDGLLKAKGKKKDDTEETSAANVPAEDLEDRIAAIVSKQLSAFQSQTASETIQSYVGQMTDNPAKQKLIMYEFQHSVNPIGTIKERLEKAQAIVDYKAVQRRSAELSVALKNKSQLPSTAITGQGQQDPETQSKSTYFSKEQVSELKSKGWSDDKIKKAEENMKRLKDRPH